MGSTILSYFLMKSSLCITIINGYVPCQVLPRLELAIFSYKSPLCVLLFKIIAKQKGNYKISQLQQLTISSLNMKVYSIELFSKTLFKLSEIKLTWLSSRSDPGAILYGPVRWSELGIDPDIDPPWELDILFDRPLPIGSGKLESIFLPFRGDINVGVIFPWNNKIYFDVRNIYLY